MLTNYFHFFLINWAIVLVCVKFCHNFIFIMQTSFHYEAHEDPQVEQIHNIENSNHHNICKSNK